MISNAADRKDAMTRTLGEHRQLVGVDQLLQGGVAWAEGSQESVRLRVTGEIQLVQSPRCSDREQLLHESRSNPLLDHGRSEIDQEGLRRRAPQGTEELLRVARVVPVAGVHLVPVHITSDRRALP